ncbi:hypothetical protein RHGRI_027339 [Rhododendron griersonianum]|uniref:Uncharacterized protein n=1 Tax=Rhododendron griersonianum TaxID=479676 RepID=A0AAV6J1W6_9ERIC|nr:hypothetical protein RHGRI_027339 [Rhododendron griersonianum]
MNGSDMWEKSGKPPIEPAEFTRQPGRPKKARRREPDEPPKNQYKLVHNTNTNTRGRGRGRARGRGRGRARGRGRGRERVTNSAQ